MRSMPMSEMGPLSFRLLSCDDSVHTLTHGTCLNHGPSTALTSHCHLPLKTATPVMVRQLFIHFHYPVSQLSSLFLKLFCCTVVLYVWLLFCQLDLRKDHVRKLIVGLQLATSCISLLISHTYEYIYLPATSTRIFPCTELRLSWSNVGDSTRVTFKVYTCSLR